MKPILAALLNHVRYYREFYVFPALASLALWASLHAVAWLTGRGVIEDVGSIVATLVCAWRLSIIASVVAGVQEALFGYRSERAPDGFLPRLRDDVFDALVTFGLLVLAGYAVFCL